MLCGVRCVFAHWNDVSIDSIFRRKWQSVHKWCVCVCVACGQRNMIRERQVIHNRLMRLSCTRAPWMDIDYGMQLRYECTCVISTLPNARLMVSVWLCIIYDYTIVAWLLFDINLCKQFDCKFSSSSSLPLHYLVHSSMQWIAFSGAWYTQMLLHATWSNESAKVKDRDTDREREYWIHFCCFIRYSQKPDTGFWRPIDCHCGSLYTNTEYTTNNIQVIIGNSFACVNVS